MTNTAQRIVLTGAPASGKTEFFERLKSVKELGGFLFLDEVARQLLEEDPGWRDKWMEFHFEIYRRQLAQLESIGERSFITDRGTVDAFAFHPETVDKVGTTIETEYARYDAVFHLESAVNLGENYYVRDEIRNESIEDVLFIERKITGVWNSHPGYVFIPAEPDVERKFVRLLNCVKLITNKDSN